MEKDIIIKGAREHNLKNIDVKIPREKLVVLTGLSGSGKSSLAFDTIYAEGQRRYVESLSSYARMFLGQMEKPDVDYIDGLSPAISIDQKTTSKNPRSTVGTVTEIYDYLRLLYARIGIPHCPKCGKEVQRQSIDQIVDKVMSLGEGTKIQILAPVIRGKKGEHKKVFENARKSGYVRVKADGEQYDLSEPIELKKTQKHNIEIIIDRLIIRENIVQRLTDSLETAIALTGDVVLVEVIGGEIMSFSQNFACDDCGISLQELTPRLFSFNNPYGACDNCDGLGALSKIDPDLVIADENLSIINGAISATGWANANKKDSMAYMYFTALADYYGFDVNTPYKDLPKDIQNIILYGTGDTNIPMNYERSYGSGKYSAPFEGVITNLERRYNANTYDYVKNDIERYVNDVTCPKCHGARLNDEVLAVTINGVNIYEFTTMSIQKEMDFVNSLELTDREKMIGEQILKEIKARLKFLLDVGLDYLSLSRSAGTLSGGEAQRIRLATQIGSGLMGVLYILDEPSIGLHQRDNDRLIETLKHLRDLGNTVIVVEHDTDTMYAADYIVDIGPGAGVNGGELVGEGTVEDLIKSPRSITGKYLSGELKIEVPKERRKATGWIEVRGAKENNLKNINVKIPTGVMTCVTGVSGSGKSSLVNEILYKKLAHVLNRARTHVGAHKEIKGIEQLDKIIDINQSPIGRTPRSNPATYTNVFGDIREVFASTNEAKVRGYKSGRFSFNVKGGRCEACSGDGIKKIEMHFLADIFVPCEVCKGKRYNRETLEVKYKGKNIYEVLEMTVDEGVEFFGNIPKIKRKLETLQEVGLGYIKLGQSSTTLSGGEAQRVKLATELSKRSTGKTIYILDEPTTGLHTADVHKLTEVLDKLVEGGNTVVVIEHNLDVIKTADYIIDMGPEGGDNGGTVIASGTPEQVAKVEKSYTGKYLKKMLE
ncbi:MAG: excinuclease ABC subunit UvrA [Hominilimicola sp.]|uniref:excinuclease ABC subunit UvrA n=1 Tax=Hominilimicola sp. TaxID=3073571 RepID=UPI00399B2757